MQLFPQKYSPDFGLFRPAIKNCHVLRLDSYYSYRFEPDNKILDITKNKNFPANFWGNNIYSVAALVGNNGSGKSTAMSFLLDFLVEGSASQSVNGIVVYENEGKLFYYGNVSTLFEGKPLESINTSMGLKDSLWKIPCFYYSGHFSPFINDDPRNSHLAGSYFASDNVLLVEDLQNYYNEDSSHMNLPLIRHLISHVAQNNYRICMMLANKKLSKIMEGFTWPKYVLIGINRSGETAIWNEIGKEKKLKSVMGKMYNKETDFEIPKFRPIADSASPEDHFLSQLIYHNLLNIIHDIWGWRNGFDIINEWQNHIKEENSIWEQFKEFVRNIEDRGKQETLLSFSYILSRVLRYSKCMINSVGDPILYIDCENNKDDLFSLGKLVLDGNQFYLTSKFFDFSYAQTLDSETILSSGEQELLNLFSRLYDAMVLRPGKFSNLQSPSLLMLDEAEIGFHPDWQRRYLKLVIDFIDTLNTIYPKLSDYQIIISTHSPILLSDIPKCCINYLKVDDGKTINANSDDIGEAFAENVFQLYRRSFFMENGLVGEFAQEKIKKLEMRIDKGETKDVLNEIKMIGDDRIREFLMDKYLKKHPEDEMLDKEIIWYYEAKLLQLKMWKENKHE